MIKRIDFEDVKLIRELYEMQLAAYRVEAEIVHFYDLPPLKESFQHFNDCGETFIGFFEGDKLAGAVSYTIQETVLTICRLFIHPSYFRKGTAQSLLAAIEALPLEISRIKVSTGKENIPAKTLYEKRGFVFIQDIEVAPQFCISTFEKKRRIE